MTLVKGILPTPSGMFAVNKGEVGCFRQGKVLKQKSQGHYNIVSYYTTCQRKAEGFPTIMRMKNKDIKEFREMMVEDQQGICPLCNRRFSTMNPRDVCADHCHDTGFMRGALCRNCNGNLGRVEGLANRSKRGLSKISWLVNAVGYLEDRKVPKYDSIHPTFKTEGEKRTLRNKKAKARRIINGKAST